MAKKKKRPNAGKELRRMRHEPLLPVEKKLIVWSLVLGAGLLVVLVFATDALFG